PIGQLSGGNVQRLVFARELARQPKLLVSFYPTRGMDVPSANAARQVLRDQRAAGGAIFLVSEDLDELFDLSDRLVVMHHGRIVTRWPASVSVTRFVAALILAIIGFGIVLLLQGRNPVDAYLNMFSVTLGTAFGRSEVVVKAIPLMLCALAVALPARVGLVNV